MIIYIFLILGVHMYMEYVNAYVILISEKFDRN